ncbi:hypothetical protein HaLaN_00450 [Haematococcus lacustris]|uniref:Uncharacterized protein n=1 Tax=Haematococcus lacustris TaxID=44745 RepID=A0A699YDG8_HAELA|nr:hypothetical protein HaLaN_00450 [Haematococcus lacustris]
MGIIAITTVRVLISPAARHNLRVIEVIKVPEGAVLRGCKKMKRKLEAHFQLRAGVHSQLRVIASFEDPVMLQQLQVFCEYFANSSKLTPYNQLQRWLGRPKQILHYSIKPAFDDPSNQELLAKLQQLSSVNFTERYVKLYAKAARAMLGWSGEDAQLFIKLTCGYSLNTDSPEPQAAHLEKAHVNDLIEEAAKQRRLLALEEGDSLQDTLRGRVVLVDEHRTSRVSSAVNGQQPCERQLNKRRATRPAGWKPPAGQAPRSSQAATQAAASEPGPSTPLPAKRSKRTKAEPAAEPTKGEGKAAKAKPAPQPGRWLDRDCNSALNMQRIGESKWRPLEMCYWPEQGALPAKGKEYPGLGYKRLRDKPPKAQQQQPAVAQ